MCILAPIEVPKVLAHIAENDHLLNLGSFGPFDLTVRGDFQMAMKRGFVREALMLCVDAFGILINFVFKDIRLLCLGDRQDEVNRLFVEFEFARLYAKPKNHVNWVIRHEYLAPFCVIATSLRYLLSIISGCTERWAFTAVW
jgi:hypothetical protein